jgi:uncharacterized phage-associated protein
MYPALDIALKMLEIAKKDGEILTHLQLQKLVYIAHGLSLAQHGKPLLKEGVETWRYGPVIPSIYHKFKRFGSGVLRKYKKSSLAIDESSQELLEYVVKKFSLYSGTQLSSLTHQKDSPWYKVWYDREGREIRGALIPDEIIKEHYDKILESGKASCL